MYDFDFLALVSRQLANFARDQLLTQDTPFEELCEQCRHWVAEGVGYAFTDGFGQVEEAICDGAIAALHERILFLRQGPGMCRRRGSVMCHKVRCQGSK